MVTTEGSTLKKGQRYSTRCGGGPSFMQFCGALLVVVRHAVDPSAHGKAPHPSIEGLQQIGSRGRVPHSRIEPQVVAVWIEEDWHTVVNSFWRIAYLSQKCSRHQAGRPRSSSTHESRGDRLRSSLLAVIECEQISGSRTSASLWPAFRC